MAVKIHIVALWVMALFCLQMVGIFSEERVVFVFRVVAHFKASCFYVVTASSFVSCSFTVIAAYGSLCPTHFPQLACFCPPKERSIFLQNFDKHLLDCMMKTTAWIHVFYLSSLLQFLTIGINYNDSLHMAQFYSVIIPTYYIHIDGMCRQ